MAIVINISRSDVMHVVEGYTVMLSQHNGGSPDFVSLWASSGERKKLDLYYREAIADLEQALVTYLKQSTATFVLTEEGSDYTLTIKPSTYWPETRVMGLLGNHVQNYLVHTVLAGWLGDFAGIQAPDYSAMAVGDLASIQSLLQFRAFDFAEVERAGDTDKAIAEAEGSGASERAADTNKDIAEAEGSGASERAADTNKAIAEAEGSGASERAADTNKAIAEAEGSGASERSGDTDKDLSTLADYSGQARVEDESKGGSDGSGTGGDARQRDNAYVRICRCGDVNWAKRELW